MNSMRHRPLVLAALALPLVGCPLFGPSPAPGPPCEDDLTACSNDTSKFVEDPTCELTGELEVTLGEGQDSFSALAPGQEPEIYFGAQGGQHMWLGVRVDNPAPDRPLLKVRVSMEYCDADCENPASWVGDNVREIVADESTLTTTGAGQLEVTGILAQIFNWELGSSRRIEMLVTDPCSRQGLIVHEL